MNFGVSRHLPFFVTPGLTRGPAAFLDEQIEKVVPVWIATFDQVELPLPSPALDALLLCDAAKHLFTLLRPNEAGQSIFSAEI
mgnify:CR=1 FL=1